MFVLSNIRLENENNDSFLKADFLSEKFGKDEIWFSVKKEYSDYLLADNYNAFLVALIYPAMLLGEDIEIKGKVSEKLYFNIKNYVSSFIKVYTKNTREVKINVDELTTEVYKTALHIGTGFSGGIDSLCTIYDHLEKETLPNYKIDTFIFLNTGSHGLYSNTLTEHKFYSRYEYLSKFSVLPFIAINSNIHKYHEFIQNSHEKTVTFTNAAGILALEHYFAKYYVASSLSYGESIEFGIKRIGRCTEAFDSILLPLLSTESITIIPDGQQYTRTEKTKNIVDYELTKKSLNVCVNHNIENEKNCSYCSKCLRTLFTLDSLEKLEDYSNIFDLKVYKKYAFKYKCQQRLEYKKNPFAKENIDFAKLHNKHVPGLIISFVAISPTLLINLIKKILINIIGLDNCKKIKRKLLK